MNRERILNLHSDGGAGTIPPTPEAPRRPDIGIYNESHRLISAAIWGPVGAEALIAQLLPTKESLFLAKMDVPKARQEAMVFNDTLMAKGVSTIMVRDEYAKLLPIDPSLTIKGVRNDILAKGRAIVETHATELQAEIDRARETGDPNGRQELWPSELERDLDRLLWADVMRYGTPTALALNRALVLEPDIPMGDAMYARDQMNVLLGSRVQSRMTFPIRQPEVAVYEKIYGEVMGLPKPIQLPDDPKYRFEGGDAYIHNGFVYMGVGFRTSIEAADHIYKKLKPELDQHGLQFAVVYDERDGTLDFNKDMEAMHLDTFSNPIGEKSIIVSTEDATPRRVEILGMDTQGEVTHSDQGPFIDFLKERGEDIVYLPKEDQANFGCNFLAIDANTIIAPMENERLRRELEVRGITLLVVPLFESTRGYGASHCMTGQLKRERPSLA